MPIMDPSRTRSPRFTSVSRFASRGEMEKFKNLFVSKESHLCKNRMVSSFRTIRSSTLVGLLAYMEAAVPCAITGSGVVDLRPSQAASGPSLQRNPTVAWLGYRLGGYLRALWEWSCQGNRKLVIIETETNENCEAYAAVLKLLTAAAIFQRRTRTNSSFSESLAGHRRTQQWGFELWATR